VIRFGCCRLRRRRERRAVLPYSEQPLWSARQGTDAPTRPYGALVQIAGRSKRSLLRRAGFRPEGAAFQTAGAVRPQLSPSGCGAAARCRLFAPERSDDVLARVSILDPDSRLTRSAVSGSSLILTPAASARALAIATAVGPRAASLVPRKGCPGRSQQRRGGSQGRSARRTRPGVSADLSRRRFAAVWAAGGGSGRLPAAANAPRTLSAQPASIG
jgi:hypothetical protein